jgi:hypothetical protein
LFIFLFTTFASEVCFAAFASNFSLSLGELYTDNVFFEKHKEHDFITVITPKLTLLYAPPGESIPTLNFNISPSGQIFARHSNLNNFGDNIALEGGYTQRFGPRFSVNFSDALSRAGDSRTGSFGENGLLSPATSPVAPGGVAPSPVSQNLKDFVSGGAYLTNQFSLQGSYLYSPNASINGGYTNIYTNFIDQGGSDIFHTISVRGVYNWRQEHNFHAGYSLSLAKSRNGDNNVIHNFDFGDDFFSNLQIRFSPTLTLAASSGISLNTGSGGLRIANNTNVTITKIWETATLSGGLRKGLTPSFGVAGISNTTSLFSTFIMRISEKLTANANVDFSRYDTNDVNFKTFQGRVGLQYLINSWLSSDLAYSYRWVDSGAGGAISTLLEKGIVRGNTVILSLAAHFELWPNPGLARSISSPFATPIVRTPFPTGAPSSATQIP